MYQYPRSCPAPPTPAQHLPHRGTQTRIFGHIGRLIGHPSQFGHCCFEHLSVLSLLSVSVLSPSIPFTPFLPVRFALVCPHSWYRHRTGNSDIGSLFLTHSAILSPYWDSLSYLPRRQGLPPSRSVLLIGREHQPPGASPPDRPGSLARQQIENSTADSLNQASPHRGGHLGHG